MQLKKLFDQLPISSKLSLLIGGLIGLTFTLLWLIINNTLIHLLNAQTDMLGNTTARQMAHASAELLLAEDLLSLKVIVNQVSQADNIARAQIRNNLGHIIADSGRPEDKRKREDNASATAESQPNPVNIQSKTQPTSDEEPRTDAPQTGNRPNEITTQTHNDSGKGSIDAASKDTPPTTTVNQLENTQRKPLLKPKLSTQHIIYSAPIVFQGVTAGHADVLLDKSLISATIERTLQWMSLAFGILLFLSLPLSYLLARYWAEPIKRLMLATRAINEGELKTRLPNQRQDEFGALMQSFNEMADSLESREKLKTTFYRYVGSGIANQVLGEPDNPVVPLRPITATIVFFDIVSFTQLCEELSPESVAKLLNHYYDCITQCCAEFGGIVDKFMGDGALVIFGAAGSKDNHAQNALLATALFLKIANDRICVPVSDSRSQLSYRISLHTGNMLAGTLGENERLQYTVVGDAVNVAARLCQKATPNQPVFSEQSRVEVPQLQPSHIESLGKWPVRGRTNGVDVYQFKKLPTPWAALVHQRARLLMQQSSQQAKVPIKGAPSSDSVTEKGRIPEI